MTRSVFDPDRGWHDEDGNAFEGMTNALLVTIFALFLVLLGWNVWLAFEWVVS